MDNSEKWEELAKTGIVTKTGSIENGEKDRYNHKQPKTIGKKRTEREMKNGKKGNA